MSRKQSPSPRRRHSGSARFRLRDRLLRGAPRRAQIVEGLHPAFGQRTRSLHGVRSGLRELRGVLWVQGRHPSRLARQRFAHPHSLRSAAWHRRRAERGLRKFPPVEHAHRIRGVRKGLCLNIPQATQCRSACGNTRASDRRAATIRGIRGSNL